MKKYVDFPLERNEMIRVEVADAEENATRGGGKPDVEIASVAFEQAVAKIRPVCTAILRQMRDAVQTPEEIVVEFGIKLSAEAGVILASTSGETNLKLSVKWKRQVPEDETA